MIARLKADKFDVAMRLVMITAVVFIVSPIIRYTYDRAVSDKIMLSSAEWKCVVVKAIPPVPAPEEDNCMMYIRTNAK